MSDTRILLTGAGGQLGRDLRRALMPLGTLTACARRAVSGSGLEPLDVTDAAAVHALVDRVAPRYIVNAAAYTAVDAAETDVDAAHAANAEAPLTLAQAGARHGAVLLHFSTDYVFAGDAHRPWREDDATDPLNEYGRSKLAGEQALAAAGAAALVLRTGWLYATHGNNFLLTMLRLRGEHPSLRVVDDQRGAPTWTRALAALSASLLAQAQAAGQDWLRGQAGVYHAGAAGECSWYDFTRRILARAGEQPSAERVLPVTTAEFPRPARRPAYSVLDGTRLWKRFGLRLPDWRVQLDAAMEDLGFDPAAASLPE